MIDLAKLWLCIGAVLIWVNLLGPWAKKGNHTKAWLVVLVLGGLSSYVIHWFFDNHHYFF